MKLTRRQLVPSMVAGATVTAALTQAALAQTTGTPEVVSDFAKAARDSVQSNMDTLSKFNLPVSIEPAFQFKA